MAAGGGEVGADAAVALQGGQGAPAALDLGRELEPADRRFRAVVGGRDVESISRPFLEWTARRPKTMWTLVWIVALVPMIYLTGLVRHYGANVPMLDDWEMAPLIVKAQTGELAWADIFQQQQEARTILPKLIFVLSAARGEWDVRDQMMLSVGICWLTAWGIFLLLRRSGLGIPGVAICFWLAVLTIFSLAQFELWILASGFPSFLTGLFLVAALVVLTRWSQS